MGNKSGIHLFKKLLASHGSTYLWILVCVDLKVRSGERVKKAWGDFCPKLVGDNKEGVNGSSKCHSSETNGSGSRSMHVWEGLLEKKTSVAVLKIKGWLKGENDGHSDRLNRKFSGEL